jgi:hypothetical protein
MLNYKSAEVDETCKTQSELQMHTHYMEVLSDQYCMSVSIGLLIAQNVVHTSAHLLEPYTEN